MRDGSRVSSRQISQVSSSVKLPQILQYPSSRLAFSKFLVNERVVEAYAVTDEWLDLYGHDVRVEFAGFLRPQVKFDSADALKDELTRNVQETRELTSAR